MSLVLAKATKGVVAPAAEAEVAALPMGARGAVPMRHALGLLGHPQEPTPLGADNSTAQGTPTGTVKQRHSKCTNMGHYWLKDRAVQGEFGIYWEPREHNKGDYSTKHHSGEYHKRVRPVMLHMGDSPTTLQGCIKLLNG